MYNKSTIKLKNKDKRVGLCLRVWRGREMRVLKKTNEQVEEIEEIGRRGLWGLVFLHNTKHSSFGELKSCIGGEFWGVLKDFI